MRFTYFSGFKVNNPPHKARFTPGACEKISWVVILFIVLTIFVELYVGTLWRRNWIQSLSDPISKKRISYLSSISKQVRFNILSTFGLKTKRRYFVEHTTCITVEKQYDSYEYWYLSSSLKISIFIIVWDKPQCIEPS